MWDRLVVGSLLSAYLGTAFGWLIRARAVRTAQLVMVYGVLIGSLMTAHLLQENLLDLGRGWNGAVALSVMGSMLLLLIAAGFVASATSGRWQTGAAAGLGSAMVAMFLTVVFGLFLELRWKPPLPEEVRRWPEYQRSGSTDAHAFATENTLQSATVHLVMGPVLGVLCGLTGGGLGRWRALSRHGEEQGIAETKNRDAARRRE